MQKISRRQDEYLYEQVVDLIEEQIGSGVLLAGDKLPSLRHLSSKLNVSLPTVRQAYLELESQSKIEARAKSGYFVQAQRINKLKKVKVKQQEPCSVVCRTLMDKVYDALHQPGVLPLGIANPCLALPATKTLHRAMKRVMLQAEDRVLNYSSTAGEPALRRQIAHRYLTQGESVNPENIIITNGAQEAMSIGLQAVAEYGDLIAVESPSYHGVLEMLESLGMKAIEIETCPEEGLILQDLEKALNKYPIKACIFSSAINNPLGSFTTNQHRQKLVEILETQNIPLIEDDVYGELYFKQDKMKLAQFYSTKGKILTCGSFSKTAAPGYRIGWLLVDEYFSKAKRLKRALSCSSGLLQQLTLAEFMASGDYDRHLKRLVPTLRFNAERMSALISQHFPRDTRLSKPQGGSVIWLELPNNINSEELFNKAIEADISIMPGTIYSPGNRYKNFIRLSYGHPWTEEIEQGIKQLAQVVKAL